MAKGVTTYAVKGIAENLCKARLVQKIVENYIEKSQMSFSVLQKVWFDDLQGRKGVIKKLSDINKNNARYYYINAPITLRDGTQISVCNQWGVENLSTFISHAGLLGFEIKSERAMTNVEHARLIL
jgi:hypothetical protein